MKKVILLIGNRYQPNVCGFIKEYEKQGGKVDGILCLQPQKDLKFYIKRPFRVLKKLKPSSVKQGLRNSICVISQKQELNTLKQNWNNSNEGENSWNLLTDKFDIFDYTKRNGIPLQFARFLSPEVVRSYTRKGPTIFPLYAGGIIPKKILDIENAEFVNAHMGEMPRYRGMNVIEWAVLEDQAPKVAVMIMNEKIDGGNVIRHKDIQLDNQKTVLDLRRVGYEYCYKAMAEGISKYLADNSLRQKQPKGAKYYYRMHTQIRKLTENKLPPTKAKWH